MPEWNAAQRPQRIELTGQLVTLAPLDPGVHGDALWEGSQGPERDPLWRYLFDGPFATRDAFDASMAAKTASQDPLFFAIVDRHSGRATGYAAYMRIETAHRVIEVGNIFFTPLLQRTPGATEAMFLMARHAFEDLGYRRYEWKCDSRNEPSRRAAVRLGFTFEGLFRQHMIVKGANRNTAWYSMLDTEWPARRQAFMQWLDPTNFDVAGRQIRSLSDFNAASA